MPTPLILDVDTGVDDAFALMLAARHPDIDLRAVTCVGGNTSVEKVVANTLQVLEAAGAGEVPVARGAAGPLIAPAREAAHVHGNDGLGGFARPSDRRAEPVGAVELLRRHLLSAAEDGSTITLVPTAPLTNIALLLRTYPEVAAGIERIVFMGGSASGGNASAVAEFNVWSDPEAAAIMLTACRDLAIEVTMYGLDVFEQVRVGTTDAHQLSDSLDVAAQLAAHLIDHQLSLGDGDVRIGDAGTVCAVIDPGALITERLPVRVDTSTGPGRGQTIVDRRRWIGDTGTDTQRSAATEVDVAIGVDAERFRAIWLTAFE